MKNNHEMDNKKKNLNIINSCSQKLKFNLILEKTLKSHSVCTRGRPARKVKSLCLISQREDALLMWGFWTYLILTIVVSLLYREAFYASSLGQSTKCG